MKTTQIPVPNQSSHLGDLGEMNHGEGGDDVDWQGGKYELLHQQAKALMEGERDLIANASNLTALLNDFLRVKKVNYNHHQIILMILLLLFTS